MSYVSPSSSSTVKLVGISVSSGGSTSVINPTTCSGAGSSSLGAEEPPQATVRHNSAAAALLIIPTTYFLGTSGLNLVVDGQRVWRVLIDFLGRLVIRDDRCNRLCLGSEKRFECRSVEAPGLGRRVDRHLSPPRLRVVVGVGHQLD